jgi:hypothetical protein
VWKLEIRGERGKMLCMWRQRCLASAADKWCPLAVVGKEGVALPERGEKGLGTNNSQRTTLESSYEEEKAN